MIGVTFKLDGGSAKSGLTKAKGEIFPTLKSSILIETSGRLKTIIMIKAI